MAQPVTRGDWLRFSVPVFSAMIDQDAGVGFLGQNVFTLAYVQRNFPSPVLCTLRAS